MALFEAADADRWASSSPRNRDLTAPVPLNRSRERNNDNPSAAFTDVKPSTLSIRHHGSRKSQAISNRGWRPNRDRRQGRWAEALASFDRAAELDPPNAAFLDNAARTYAQVRRYAKAAELYRREPRLGLVAR